MFVSVRPDASTRQRLAALQLGPVPGLRLVDPEDWHITLRFLGQVDEALVPSLADAIAAGTRVLTGPVRAVLGPGTAWFPGERVLQIPVAGLDSTAAAVRSATIPLVPDAEGSGAPFQGHLTIGRATRHGPDPSVRTALAGIPFSSTFAVGAIHLMGPHQPPGRPRYRTLGRVALPG